jgi:amino acid transporter
VAFGRVTGLALALGLPLTYSYGGARTFGYLAGAASLSVVLIYLAVNLSAFRASRTGFRAEFRVWRHLVIPAAAVVFFFLSGDPAPARRALMDLLPFTALGWLGLGFIAASVLRAQRPARFEALGRVFLPADDNRRLPRDIECGRELTESPAHG